MTAPILDTETRLLQLEQDNATLHTLFQMEREQNRRERRRLRVQAGLAFVALVGAIFLSPANRAALAQGYGITLASLNTRLLAVENKTQFVSVTGGEMYLKGTNLHVENGVPNPGLDKNAPGFLLTPMLNGKGNLIIGYNTLRSGYYGTDNARMGSHNLIVGDFNNYSGLGGIVIGNHNNIGGLYSSVSGGAYNTADFYTSTVSGGEYNTAHGEGACVSGGAGNVANAQWAAVSGGGNITQSNSGGWSGGPYHAP